MLDSIYHMALKYLKHAVWCKNVPYFMHRYMDVITFPENL